MHRSLDGDAPQPFEHFLGRLCEEFHCLPSAAWREWLALPAGTLETIIEYRIYAAAYAAYRQHPKATGAMVDQVRAIESALVQAALDDAE